MIDFMHWIDERNVKRESGTIEAFNLSGLSHNPRFCLTGASLNLLHFYPKSIISSNQLDDAVRGLEDGRRGNYYCSY